jgi:hypothetical protein
VLSSLHSIFFLSQQKTSTSFLRAPTTIQRNSSLVQTVSLLESGFQGKSNKIFLWSKDDTLHSLLKSVHSFWGNGSQRS